MTFHLNGVGDIVQGLPRAAGSYAAAGLPDPVLALSGEMVATPTTTGGLLPQMPGVPKFTTAEMPTITGTAMAVVEDSPQPVLTPQALNQKLPSIIDTTPMVMPTACNSLSSWVEQNPMLAMAALAAAAFVVFNKEKN